MSRFFYFSGGLSGALSIILYAASYHFRIPFLAVLSPLLLMHAPIFLFFATHANMSNTNNLPSLLILIGLVIFVIDVLCVVFFQRPLIPYLSVIGGLLMAAGWILIAFSALVVKKNRKSKR